MKAETVYEVLLTLKQEERERFFKIIEKPMPPVQENPYLNGWKGLSEYLGGTPVRNLHEFAQRGIIIKYKIGKKVIFKKEEIDKTLEAI